MNARGPNYLNLVSYARGDGEQIQYNPDQMAEIVQAEGVNMQQQFEKYVADNQKYDQILIKMAKSINQVSASQHFITDFYPKFVLECMYDTDTQKRVVTQHDVELSRVMESLQLNNRNLKQQVKGWLFQYAKKTRLSQVLLTENKLLRKYVCAKNKDIVKLIQTITNADNQQLNQLNQNLNQLKQQNGMLLDHLKQIKQTLKDKTDQQLKIVNALSQAQKDKINIQSKIREGQDQQQHYSKLVSLLQTSINQASKRQKNLLQQKERLMKLKKQYQNDQQQIKSELDACQIDKKQIDKQLKNRFKGHQTQKQKLIDQIENLTEKIKRTKDQSNRIQQQIKRHELGIQDYNNFSKDIDKKIADIIVSKKKSEQEYKKLKDEQIQQLSAKDIISYQIQMIQNQIEQLKAYDQQKQQKLKSQLSIYEKKKNDQVLKANQQYGEVQRKNARVLIQQKADIASKKKQVEQWKKKVQNKKREIQQLKEQLVEVKQNQALAANLKQKLRQAQKQKK